MFDFLKRNKKVDPEDPEYWTKFKKDYGDALDTLLREAKLIQMSMGLVFSPEEMERVKNVYKFKETDFFRPEADYFYDELTKSFTRVLEDLDKIEMVLDRYENYNRYDVAKNSLGMFRTTAKEIDSDIIAKKDMLKTPDLAKNFGHELNGRLLNNLCSYVESEKSAAGISDFKTKMGD